MTPEPDSDTEDEDEDQEEAEDEQTVDQGAAATAETPAVEEPAAPAPQVGR